MNQSQPKQYSASTHRAVSYGGGIEWEELPSMGRRVSIRQPDFGPTSGFGMTWAATAPVELDALPPSQPFREAVEGLATREVNEPDVFQHFFGDNPVVEAYER